MSAPQSTRQPAETSSDDDPADGHTDSPGSPGNRAHPDRTRSGRARPRRTPAGQSYLLRRAVFVGVVVALIALIAIVIGRIIGDDTRTTDSPGVSDSWNTVVVLTDDRIELRDPSTGEVLDTYDSSPSPLDAASETSGETLVLLALDGLTTQLDLTDGTARRSRSEADGVLDVSTGPPTVMSAGVETGGDLHIVDTNRRSATSIADAAQLADPMIFADDLLVNISATHAAVSDRATFQSVLVDLEAGTAQLLAGQTGALNDTTLVTVQRAGAVAELDFYDVGGDRIGTVTAPSPQTMLLSGEKEALLVARDGRVVVTRDNGSVDEVRTLTGEDEAPIQVRGGHPAFGDRRLVVQTSAGVFVLDDDGDVVTSLPGQVASALTYSTRCIVVGDGTSTGVSSHVDLDSGEVLGTLTGGLVADTSLDGCTAAVIGAPSPQVLYDGEVLEIDAPGGSLSTVAPDGRFVVASSPDGEVLIDVGSGDRIDLATEPAVVRFADVP